MGTVVLIMIMVTRMMTTCDVHNYDIDDDCLISWSHILPSQPIPPMGALTHTSLFHFHQYRPRRHLRYQGHPRHHCHRHSHHHHYGRHRHHRLHIVIIITTVVTII